MRFEKESLFLSFSIKGVVYLVMNRLTDNPNFGIGIFHSCSHTHKVIDHTNVRRDELNGEIELLEIK